MTFSPTQKLSLHRLISAMSVRNRIAAIAVVPVIGFLANGLAFTSGETQVGTAFEAVRGAAVLADASREFKAALAGMQMAAKDFVAQPSDEEIKAFNASQELASSSLDTIASSIDDAQRSDVDTAREALGGMRLNFDALAEEERELGFAPDQGTRKTLEDSGAMIERAIAGGVSWLSADEQTRLLVSLSNMRRFEAQYRLSRQTPTWEAFFKEYRAFGDIVQSATAELSLRTQLDTQVKSYAANLAQWNRRAENTQGLLMEIALGSQHAAAGGQDHRLGQSTRRDSISGVGFLAVAHQAVHHLGRRGGGADRARIQLVDRPQHHAAAPPAGRRHAEARGR